MRITIDGRVLETSGAPTILDAARRLGISIPTLCEHRRLVPYAACRICLVEIAGRKLPAPACATPVEEGMEVITNSPKIQALRREVLDLILSEHPSACLICLEKENCEEAKSMIRKTGEPTGCILCPADGRCDLQKVVTEVGLKGLSHPMTYRGSGVRRDDPFIDRDDGLCILCGRCVRVCHEIRGADAIAFVARGSRVTVGTSMGKRLLDVGCLFCGACVDVCPTGALTERAVRYASKFEEQRSFICGLCGQGCRLGLRLRGGRPVDVRPEDGSPNDGQACVKGRFVIGDLLGHPKRFVRPMVRRAGVLVETSWEDALAAAGRGLAEHKGKTAVVCSARDSCEDLWALGRLSRDVLHASSVRLAEDSAAYLLGCPDGAEIYAPPMTVDELSQARIFFIFEESLHLTAPIFGVAVNQALLKGAKLVLVGDGEYCLDRYAAVRVKAGPAEAGGFLTSLLRVLINKNNSHDRGRPAGFESLRQVLRTLPPDSPTASVKLDRIVGFLEKRRPAAFIFGPRFVAGPWGHRNAALLWNLAGHTGGLYVPVGWEANARGAVEIMAEINRGAFPRSAELNKPRALILAGPDAAFKRAGEEFVVALDAFHGDAAAQADVVLPRTVFAEQEGMFVNAEGRLQFSSAAVTPAGEARLIRSIAADLARALGAGVPALETRDAAFKDLIGAVPSLAEAIRIVRGNRPALIAGKGFAAKGFVDIPDLDMTFDPAAAFPLRDPDDYLNFPTALEIKSLRTARRR
ncbi:MAG: molybdopterin-dependent oxidoreductase [Candidatus Aminicenantes bacterium]|nr:molybdopterin-dependent oxidoreductase [Candidatus Aminicenantes bacterium]